MWGIPSHNNFVLELTIVDLIKTLRLRKLREKKMSIKVLEYQVYLPWTYNENNIIRYVSPEILCIETLNCPQPPTLLAKAI